MSSGMNTTIKLKVTVSGMNLPMIFKVGTDSGNISVQTIQYVDYNGMRQSWYHPSIIRAITSKDVPLGRKDDSTYYIFYEGVPNQIIKTS